MRIFAKQQDRAHALILAVVQDEQRRLAHAAGAVPSPAQSFGPISSILRPMGLGAFLGRSAPAGSPGVREGMKDFEPGAKGPVVVEPAASGPWSWTWN